MLVDLKKEDLIKLVKSISPYFTAMNEPYIKGKGHYDDYRSSWEWDETALKNAIDKTGYKVLSISCEEYTQKGLFGFLKK